MTIAWGIAALVLGLLELLSVDLFFLTLGIASFVTMFAALAGTNIWVQLLVFASASLLLLIFVRPWAKRYLQRSTPNIETGARGLVGKTAVVTAPLVGTGGRVRLDGGDWSARSLTGDLIPVGSQVMVAEIDGATAVVCLPPET